MDIQEIATKAAEVIKGYRSNAVIMDFVKAEAFEKVAAEIRAEMGGCTTAKAAELLSYRHKNIAARVERYIEAGLVGCFVASLEA